MIRTNFLIVPSSGFPEDRKAMRRLGYQLWLIAAMQILAGLCAAELFARAGGGDSFSGGGGSGGSGGDGGGDGAAIIYLVIQLIRLLFYLWTEGGIPGKIACFVIVGGIIAFFVYRQKSKKVEAEQAIAGRVYRNAASPQRLNALASGLAKIKRHDPNFSRVLFLDFAHLIFTKLQESRGGNPEAAAIAPYLSSAIRERLKREPVKVSNVVVGVVNLDEMRADESRQRITARFKANVVEIANGAQQRILIEQKLVFERANGVLTTTPDKVLSLGCPNCGSREEPTVDGKCPSCGTVTARGKAGWQVVQVETLRRQSILESVTTSAGVEEGTASPTIVAPDLQAALRDLKMRDASFTLEALTQRARHMFMEVQTGWSEIDATRLRPFETDTLFDAHRYWLERFKETGTRNVLDDVTIMRMQLAKIEHDAYYDAVTLRVYASMKDFYKDRSGKVIGGNANVKRVFSEYWTLVRRVEAAGRKTGDPAKCPSCGAPLDRINQAGICEYCGGKVISGAFDWVVALITQDEEYAG